MADDKIKIEIPFQSNIEWKDITHEKSRQYVWVQNGEKYSLTIKNPLKLSVSESGGHRIFGDAKCLYIAPGWSYILWEPAEGLSTEESYRY